MYGFTIRSWNSICCEFGRARDMWHHSAIRRWAENGHTHTRAQARTPNPLVSTVGDNVHTHSQTTTRLALYGRNRRGVGCSSIRTVQLLRPVTALEGVGVKSRKQELETRQAETRRDEAMSNFRSENRFTLEQEEKVGSRAYVPSCLRFGHRSCWLCRR